MVGDGRPTCDREPPEPGHVGLRGQGLRRPGGGGQPLNGYEVAKASGAGPRSTVYETLAKLVARGAAYEVRSGEESIEYMPLPPASLVSRPRREIDCRRNPGYSLTGWAVMP